MADTPDWRRFEPTELTPVLSAALDAFTESGFHGTTVREIARRVGQTVPVIYYHHENKECVLATLLELATREIVWRAEAAAAEAGDDPEAALRNVIEAVVLHMTHRHKLAMLDSELRHLSPETRADHAATRKRVEDLLLRVITDGCERGALTAPVPAETARALLGMCQSVQRWYSPGGPLSPEDIAARYVEIAALAVGLSR